MNKAIGGIALVIGLILVPLSSRVSASSNFVISELQAGSKTSASEEFIQITNQSADTIDITGWRLEYFSANPKNFSTPARTITLSGKVQGKEDFIVASTNYKPEADAWFAPTLAASGGHVRLVRGSNSVPIILDLVGWGAAVNPEGTAIKAPGPGETLERSVNKANDYVDTDNNLADFAGDAVQLGISEDVSNSNVTISELLPNPASPVVDSVGEFIELYNPGDSLVALKGYKLLSGASLSHSFVFKDQVLKPGYTAFYVPETHLALSNSGGKVQFQSPTGQVIAESAAYGTAPDGQSWVWDGGAWAWSVSPTPNAENNVVLAAEKLSTNVKTAKTAKKTSFKKTKATTGKVKGLSTAGSTKADTEETPPAPMHGAVLAGVGSLAILYGIYEYRQDIANTFRKLRSNRRNRA